MQRALERVHGEDGVARVLPPVRVVAAELHRLREVDDGRVAARALDRVLDPGVGLAAGADDQVGVGERAHVVRADLVVVRVGVRLQQLHDMGVRAGDVAGEIGDLRWSWPRP